MKTFAYNLFAATVIASATVPASAEMLTFENLPNPTTEIGQDLKVGVMPHMYNGFSFNSSNDDSDEMFDNRWGYYKMRAGSTYGGFDEGIIGSRALFTPWGANEDYEFSITRTEAFMFEGAYITQVNRSEDDFNFDGDERDYSILTVKGFVGDTQVYSLSTQIEYAVGQFLSFNTGMEVTRVEFSTNTGAAIALDNFTYSSGAVPAPSALALLGLAGIVGRRRR
jgi:MYXO-CTERM domain-containing protein